MGKVVSDEMLEELDSKKEPNKKLNKGIGISTIMLDEANISGMENKYLVDPKDSLIYFIQGGKKFKILPAESSS